MAYKTNKKAHVYDFHSNATLETTKGLQTKIQSDEKSLKCWKCITVVIGLKLGACTVSHIENGGFTKWP